MRFSQSTCLLSYLSCGDFNIHHKDWLIYSNGTNRPGELCYNFSFSNNLNHMVDFPTQISDCDFHSSALLDLLLSSDLVFVIQWLSVYQETLIMLSQFPVAFLQT